MSWYSLSTSTSSVGLTGSAMWDAQIRHKARSCPAVGLLRALKRSGDSNFAL